MPVVENGLFKPIADQHGINAALEQVTELEHAIELCTHKRVAVQAGGNCGVFPEYLSRQFEVVYTFEPENENFFCLVNNAPAKNIIKFQAAIGENSTPRGLFYAEKNAGAHHIEGDGILPVIALDSLNLPVCDLLQLDIEGYELFALRGAVKTIRAHAPVIMIEHKRHATRYGAKPDDVLDFLKFLGYEEAKRVRKDIIFTRGKNA